MAQYGAYKYESVESRALKGINADSYNKDQAKNLIQLNQNTEYMAQYMRKLQKGVDDANKNVIEQIQGFINDIIVLLGGGGNTGLDFGDLKYIFQAWGALFGFTDNNGNIQLPVNLFQAAWHFFSTYIIPLNGFGDVINTLIDAAIATLIDSFGEVPIIGEALQQLAVILTDFRDAIAPLGEAIQKIFDAFGGSIDWVIGWFADLIHALFEIFGPIIGPTNTVLAQIFGIIATWTAPFAQFLTHVVDVVTNMIRSLTGGLDYSDFTDENFNIITVIGEMVTNFINNGILGISSALNAANIFGLLQSWNIPFLPISHLTNTNGPNLLVEPGFDDPDSIQLGVGWSYDNTVGHTKNGCAKAVANGIAKRELVSIPVPVAENDKFSLSGWLRWTGLVYTGVPIRVNINKYLAGVLIGSDDVLIPVAPATNQPTWLNLSNNYTIPAGVDTIRVSMQVAASTSTGSIWFDDFELKKLGNALPQAWIFNLIPDLAGLRDFIQSVIEGITGVIGNGVEDVRDFLSNITGNIGTLFSNLGSLVYDLLHDPAARLGQLGQEMVTGLQGALTNLNSFIQNVVEGVIQAIKGVPFVGAGIADMIATLTGYKKDVKDVQVATKNFTMSSMAVARQPGWVSDYSLCAATYPAILNSQWSVFSDTVGPATAGTAHSHAIRGDGAGGDNARAVSAYWGYSPGKSAGGFITPTEDMVFSGFSFTAYSSATPVAGDFFFELFRVNPDGSMIQLVSSDVSTFITTSGNTIDNSWNTFRCVAARGEKHLARLRNASSSKTLSILGLQWRKGVPDIQWETNNSTDTNKTSYTSAEHDTISGNSIVTAWMQLKADDSDVPESYTWTDDFERPSLGYFWNQSLDDTGGDLAIVNGNMAYGGTTNGFQQAIYIRPVATDQFRCDVNLVSIAGTGFTNIIVGANRESTYYVAMQIGLTSVRLVTVINGVSNTRATVAKSNNDGKWSITYNKTTKVYTMLFNDVPVAGLTWTDSGNAMPLGALYRYGHVQLQRTAGVNSGVVQDWQLQDWTP